MINLKKVRLDRNLTQDELAHKIGVTLRTYQYIEYGQRKPSYSVILKLQGIFNKSIDTLLTELDTD